MAATQNKSFMLQDVPSPVQRLQFSSLVPAGAETVTLKGPSGVSPTQVRMMTKTLATSKDPVFFAWTGSSSSADTITVEFDTVAAGDLTGAVCEVYIEWNAAASGGTS